MDGETRLLDQDLSVRAADSRITSWHDHDTPTSVKVRDFVNFVTLVYSTWWITINSMEDVPWNDLNLYQSLLKFEDVHPDISSSAIPAFQLHLWYLTAELVSFALWSNKVSEDA